MLHPVYVIFHVFIWLVGIYEINKNKKLSSSFILGCALYLIFFATIKYRVGADYGTYVRIFFSVKESDMFDWKFLLSPTFKTDLEVSYLMVCRIIADLGLEFHWLLFFYGALSISLKSYMLYNYSPYPVLSFMLYYMPLYFFEDQTQIRQGLAIGITFFSFIFIIKRKLIPFLITVLIAYFFHKTSIVFVFAYWIAPLRINTFFAILAVIFSIVLSSLKIHLLIGPIVGNLGAEEAHSAFVQYSKYGDASTTLLGELAKVFLMLMIFLGDKECIEKYPKYFYFRNLALMYFILYYLLRGNAIFAIRLPGAYQPFIFLTAGITIYCAAYSMRNIFFICYFLYSILIHWRFIPNGIGSGFDRNTNIIFDHYDYNEFRYGG